MATYRYRTEGADVTLEASKLEKAIARARQLEAKGYAWLTDEDGWTVWESTEERADA